MIGKWCKGSADGKRSDHWVPPEYMRVVFSDDGSVRTTLRKRSRCRVCIQTTRDTKKNENRFRVKASSTISSHAKRYSKRWSVPVSEARMRLERLGWTIDYIAAMFEEAEAAGVCAECDWQWDYGEHEMTLEVGNPDTPSMNTCSVWCRSCNGRKGAIGQEDYALFKQYMVYESTHNVVDGNVQLKLVV